MKKFIHTFKLFEAITKKNMDGKCHEVAYKYLMSHTDVTLVHGLVNGQGPLEGILYNHAWCESNGKIIDMTLKKEVQKSLPIDLYYAIGGIKTTYKYSFKEVLEKVDKFGTYGPWDKNLLKNKY